MMFFRAIRVTAEMGIYKTSQLAVYDIKSHLASIPQED